MFIRLNAGLQEPLYVAVLSISRGAEAQPDTLPYTRTGSSSGSTGCFEKSSAGRHAARGWDLLPWPLERGHWAPHWAPF